MKRIAILASGSGTNAENLVRHFQNHPSIEVACVITNRCRASVIERLRPLDIEVEYYGKECWDTPTAIATRLQQLDIDLVVLAGFLAVIREPLLTTFSGRIVNIHPSLLPLHGGPGMYGHHVHEAVLAAGERQSGITIHVVDKQVDGGRILAQYPCEVLPGDTAETLASRIHPLEYAHYPHVIEQYLTQLD